MSTFRVLCLGVAGLLLGAAPAAAGRLTCTEAGKVVFSQSFTGEPPSDVQDQASRHYPSAACFVISDAPKELELPASPGGDAPASLNAALQAITGHRMPPAPQQVIEIKPAAKPVERSPEPIIGAMLPGPSIAAAPKIEAPAPNWVKLATYRDVSQEFVLAHWTDLVKEEPLLEKLTPALTRGPYGYSILSAGPIPLDEMKEACFAIKQAGASCEPGPGRYKADLSPALDFMQSAFPGYIFSLPKPAMTPYRLTGSAAGPFAHHDGACLRAPIALTSDASMMMAAALDDVAESQKQAAAQPPAQRRRVSGRKRAEGPRTLP